MRLRSITFGRGIVLLILGIAVGTGLFLQSRLSPETLRDQVETVLAEKFAVPFELREEQVEIQLQHGLGAQRQDAIDEGDEAPFFDFSQMPLLWEVPEATPLEGFIA